MAVRRLSAEEATLWRKVAATVTPMSGKAALLSPSPSGEGLGVGKVSQRPAPVTSPTPTPPLKERGVNQVTPLPRPAPHHAATLDASWDRRLARGLTAPDRIIDLHGHNLASAHALLDTELDRAVRRGDRVILLVTGRPPKPESERPHARGAIRAAVADWLASSRHSGAIAAVRGAHPRHGGAGALYVVLRRGR